MDIKIVRQQGRVELTAENANGDMMESVISAITVGGKPAISISFSVARKNTCASRNGTKIDIFDGVHYCPQNSYPPATLQASMESEEFSNVIDYVVDQMYQMIVGTPTGGQTAELQNSESSFR